MKLNLIQDIKMELNAGHSIVSYDLPDALTEEKRREIENLVKNAPVAYSFEVTKSPCYPNGSFLRFVKK